MIFLAVVKLSIEIPTSNPMNWLRFTLFKPLQINEQKALISSLSNNVGGSFMGVHMYLHNRKLVIVEY